jgi:hypothetical protein
MKRIIEPSRGNLNIRLLSQRGDGPLKRYHQKIFKAIEPLRKKGVARREICDFLNKRKMYSFRGHPWKVARLSQVIQEV